MLLILWQIECSFHVFEFSWLLESNFLYLCSTITCFSLTSFTTTTCFQSSDSNHRKCYFSCLALSRRQWETFKTMPPHTFLYQLWVCQKGRMCQPMYIHIIDTEIMPSCWIASFSSYGGHWRVKTFFINLLKQHFNHLDYNKHAMYGTLFIASKQHVYRHYTISSLWHI